MSAGVIERVVVASAKPSAAPSGGSGTATARNSGLPSLGRQHELEHNVEIKVGWEMWVDAMRFLVVESETEREREERRASAGKSAGESFAATLRQMLDGCSIRSVTPSDPDVQPTTSADVAQSDAVFLSGSPLHVYDDTDETRRQIAFMREVFASGTPSFGSCAGLQIAVAAAGGRVRKMVARQEAGIAHGITRTDEGRDHALLAGRPVACDAPAIHGDEVEELPKGSILLASNAAVHVQAAEIRCGNGVFWGVQYHPELAPGEIAAALRRQSSELQEAKLADTDEDVEVQASLLDDLHRQPERTSRRWRLGVGAEFAQEDLRRRELRNFLDHVPRLRGREQR